MFAVLAEQAPDLWEFLFTGGASNLRDWWAAAAGTAGDWFAQHPVIQQSPWHMRVPLGIHGDDAGMAGAEKVLVLSWGSVAIDLGTLDSRLVFCMIRDSECRPQATLQTVYQVLSWSFQALAAGVWPASDHAGRPFSAAYHPTRAARAGRALHPGGVRGAWVELRGDWKFLRECLRLTRWYGRNELCHLCMAHKRAPAYLYTDFGRHAHHRATRVTHVVWLAAAIAAAMVSPLLAIPGFHIWRAFFDIMHTLEPRAPHRAPRAFHVSSRSPCMHTRTTHAPHACTARTHVPGSRHIPARGSLRLVRARYGGGFWLGATLAARLEAATREYRAWCRTNRIASVAKRLNPSWVALPFPQISQTHAKAAALRSMVYWMREICIRAVVDGHSALRAGMFEAFVQADLVMRAHGRHMPADAREAVAVHFEAALHAYHALATECLQRGVPLYRLIPKLHALTHLAYDGDGTNPRSVQCYADEDLVGRMKRLYGSCHGATAPRASLQRYALLACVRWWRRLAVLRGVPPEIAGVP